MLSMATSHDLSRSASLNDLSGIETIDREMRHSLVPRGCATMRESDVEVITVQPNE
jgi:hypothetical protein